MLSGGTLPFYLLDGRFPRWPFPALAVSLPVVPRLVSGRGQGDSGENRCTV
jgi:hypothetical protein